MWKRAGVSLAVTMAVTACGGGGADGGGGAPALTGTVSAPSALSLALRPTSFSTLLAEAIWGKESVAVTTGWSAVPSGVEVRLIQVDTTGAQVGATIATATTNADGGYSLTLPSSFSAGPQYVVRVGSVSNYIDARVTATGTLDVDPATDAASEIVVSLGDLTHLSIDELNTIVDLATAAVVNLDDASVATVATDIKNQVLNNEENANTVHSTVSSGSICGHVQDSSATALANIKVVVRDFRDWVTRAEAKTDANGDYCVNVPKQGDTDTFAGSGTLSGEYIIGALNFTGASMAASEWYSAAGGSPHMFNADKVTVPGSGGTVTRNFELSPGARITGSIVVNGTTTALPGVQFGVRDFTADMPVAFTRVKDDGTFRINVAPGTYTLGARNSTSQPYAGGTYNGSNSGGSTSSGGGSMASAATPMTLVAGNAYTANFGLVPGAVIKGQVTDGSNPVHGISVRFYRSAAGDGVGAFVEALRTNKDGNYRMWVQPGDYKVRARGQTASLTSLAANSINPTSFTVATVGRVTATLCAPNTGGSTGNACTPLTRSKVQVHKIGASPTFQGFEVSEGDGTVVAYTPDSSSTYKIEYKIDNGSTTAGSAIDNGTNAPTAMAMTAGTAVTFSSGIAALGERTMPAGGELKGTVTVNSSATGNVIVQVRKGGVTSAESFTSTRTQSDGSYSISLPSGVTYDNLCAYVTGTTNSCPTGGSSQAGAYASTVAVGTTTGTSATVNLAIP